MKIGKIVEIEGGGATMEVMLTNEEEQILLEYAIKRIIQDRMDQEEKRINLQKNKDI